MVVTLKKLSICNCGYGLLKDDITIGTEYDINPSITTFGIIICGGCKTTIKNLGMVWVEGSSTGQPGFIPRIIFEPLEERERGKTNG